MTDPSEEVVAALRHRCTRLPEVDEEAAWTGVRWRVRGRTFAHVLVVDGGWPPVYARAIGSDGPRTLLMFRASGEELDALRHGDPRCFAPPWRQDEVGIVLGDEVDWVEIGELVTESWRVMAPKRLSQAFEADVEQ